VEWKVLMATESGGQKIGTSTVILKYHSLVVRKYGPVVKLVVPDWLIAE
jgi:hypothetical protein